MNAAELETRQRMMSTYHAYAVMWLGLVDDPDEWFARQVRRWVQRIKLRLIDDIDPARAEMAVVVDRALERAFHPDRVLADAGVTIPRGT